MVQDAKVRALCFDGFRPQLVERAEPELKDGWVLVRPLAAGICNTDLEIVRGYLGFRGVLGHELVGVVEQGPGDWLGKRVVSEINFACGSCPSCEAGLERHCPSRTVLGIVNQDGAFAELVAVPATCLHQVPAALDDEEAVFAEPLAAAFAVLDQVELGQNDEALVLGDGKLGLLIAQVLALGGARVLAVGKHPEHLAILKQRGIDTVLLEDFDRRPRPLVVDATGAAAGFGLALEVTAPRGTLVLKSTVAQDRTAPQSIDLAPIVINEIRLLGSRCGVFAPALAALEAGQIEVRTMIAARFALDDGVEALECAAQSGALKVLLCADQARS